MEAVLTNKTINGPTRKRKGPKYVNLSKVSKTNGIQVSIPFWYGEVIWYGNNLFIQWLISVHVNRRECVGLPLKYATEITWM